MSSVCVSASAEHTLQKPFEIIILFKVLSNSQFILH